jgi:predicted anti-sigma-YlaC factor YlaD
MECTLFRDMLDAYLEETLEEDRREVFRGHLRSCGACRSWAVEHDPSLLFAAAGEPPADPARVETCAAAVSSQIRQLRLRRRLYGHRRGWLAAAASAVLVIVAALAWLSVSGGGGPASMASAPATEAESAAPPTVEVEMAGEGVRVYQFTSDGDPDTAAYFIVNPALEL